MPRIQRIDIPQLVKVRKYEVDNDKLQILLREHKKIVGKSNKSIAEALQVPKTKVEHWFRTDSCFAIPEADVWERLKSELEITTTEFDEAITTFEERPGVYEKSERCYFVNGIAPTLTGASAGNEKIIVGDYKMKDENKNATAVAMRGRYGEDGCIRQHIETTDREYANALTTVQKDSMVQEAGVRIRKLTPKECFRLMGFDDADFEKAAAVNSNTQLYKQAGNSIVVPVLEHVITAIVRSGVWNI